MNTYWVCYCNIVQVSDHQSALEGFSVEDESMAGSPPSNQFSLEQQRLMRINEEKKQEKLKQQELARAEKEQQQKENERIKRKELVRL